MVAALGCGAVAGDGDSGDPDGPDSSETGADGSEADTATTSTDADDGREAGDSDDAGEESGDGGGSEGPDEPGDPLTFIGDDHRLRIHPNLRCAELEIPSDELAGWQSGEFTLLAAASVKRLRQWFDDDFDFVVFTGDSWAPNPSLAYLGQYVAVRNDASGIGLDLFDFGVAYNSPAQLQGVIHLSGIRNVVTGPSLHEFMHRWGNYLLPTTNPLHWGFAEVGGQLGGFDELLELGDGVYQGLFEGEASWGPVANGGNGHGYSPFELYLMGLLAPEAVAPIRYAEQVEWLGGGQFAAASLTTLSIEETIAEFGPRLPDVVDAQRGFRVLFVAIVDAPLSDELFDRLDVVVADFTRDAAPQRYAGLVNFWLATQGEASLDAEGIDDSLAR